MFRIAPKAKKCCKEMNLTEAYDSITKVYSIECNSCRKWKKSDVNANMQSAKIQARKRWNRSIPHV